MLAYNTRICLGQKGFGTIKYIGPLPDKEINYYGIELDKPTGTHDGSYKNKQYFMTRPKHGIFVSCRKLKSLGEGTFIARKYVNRKLEDSFNEDNLNEHLNENNLNEHFNNIGLESGKENNLNDKVTVNLENEEKNIKNKEKNIENEVKKFKNSDSNENAYKKLKTLYRTQKIYYQQKIEDLKQKMNKQNFLKKENLKLKQKLKNKNTKFEKLDENILGIAKDLLKMKRNVNEVIHKLENQPNDVNKELIILLKNLTDSIFDDDEENVQKYFFKYQRFMNENGINCNID